MKLNAYCYFDLEGTTYDVPFFAKEHLHAKRRMYGQIKAEPNSPLALFTDQFDLMYIGEFDTNTGDFTPDEKDCVIRGHRMNMEINKVKEVN
jgi:hypothetical protein